MPCHLLCACVENVSDRRSSLQCFELDTLEVHVLSLLLFGLGATTDVLERHALYVIVAVEFAAVAGAEALLFHLHHQGK